MASTRPVVENIPRGLEQPGALHQREGETTATLAHPQSWCLQEGHSIDIEREQLTRAGSSFPCACSRTKAMNHNIATSAQNKTRTVVGTASDKSAQGGDVENRPGSDRETCKRAAAQHSSRAAALMVQAGSVQYRRSDRCGDECLSCIYERGVTVRSKLAGAFRSFVRGASFVWPPCFKVDQGLIGLSMVSDTPSPIFR